MMNINEVANTITTVRNANEIIECMNNIISALREGAQARTVLKRQFGKHTYLCLDTLWRYRLVTIEVRAEEMRTVRRYGRLNKEDKPVNQYVTATLPDGRTIEVRNPDYDEYYKYGWYEDDVHVQRKYYALKEGV